MLNQELIVKRLALIKFLYKSGIEQSKQAEPISSFSVLSFHDSIEMFLKLLAEHLNLKSDSFNFLDYWDKIPTLTLKESCRTLNARRVNIKHKGLLPSKGDIEASRVTTTEFFEQNTTTHFSVDFSTISLLTLVAYPTVRQLLEEAQEALNTEQFQKSIEKSAFAFDELLQVYEISKKDFRSSPFNFGKSMSFQRSYHLGITDQKFASFVDNVKESIESLRHAIKVISMGIDYRRFIKFNILTPNVLHTIGGRHSSGGWGNEKWNEDNCQYCIDFVVESSMKVQEFDFDLEELLHE